MNLNFDGLNQGMPNLNRLEANGFGKNDQYKGGKICWIIMQRFTLYGKLLNVSVDAGILEL